MSSVGVLTACSSDDSMASLYVDHHRWLQNWLRKKIGNTWDAADVSQDTFLSVMSGAAGFDISEPRPLLITIARRHLFHRRRRQLLETSYLEMLALLPEESAPSPEVRLQALEVLQQIDAALDGLPGKVRQAFLLVHLDDLSYKEAAERLRVSSSSVKQYLQRANRHCLFVMAA